MTPEIKNLILSKYPVGTILRAKSKYDNDNKYWSMDITVIGCGVICEKDKDFRPTSYGKWAILVNSPNPTKSICTLTDTWIDPNIKRGLPGIAWLYADEVEDIFDVVGFRGGELFDPSSDTYWNF